MLTALRASADAGTPVGVACGSVGALRGVWAERIAEALERFLAGDWNPRALPALAIETADGAREWALNDLVIVRRVAGQIAATSRSTPSSTCAWREAVGSSRPRCGRPRTRWRSAAP